jgi:hypothetical protein
MKAWPKHNVSIDADYEPPSVNRWTSEDDLVQRLFAPPPIEYTHEHDGLGEDIWIGVLVVLFFVAGYILLTH